MLDHFNPRFQTKQNKKGGGGGGGHAPKPPCFSGIFLTGTPEAYIV